MQPIGNKEKKDLFFKYFVLFMTTAAVLLFALFFTQEPAGDMGLNENEKELYKEFKKLDQLKPALMNLIDSTIAQTAKIEAQNAGSSFAKDQAISNIERFQSANNTQDNEFLGDITQMLRNYIMATDDIKKAGDFKIQADQELIDCRQRLQFDLINKGNRSQSPSQ
jgi:hypothetical protein